MFAKMLVSGVWVWRWCFFLFTLGAGVESLSDYVWRNEVSASDSLLHCETEVVLERGSWRMSERKLWWWADTVHRV